MCLYLLYLRITYEDVLVVHTCVHTTARDRTPLSGHQAVVDAIYHIMAAQNTSPPVLAHAHAACVDMQQEQLDSL